VSCPSCGARNPGDAAWCTQCYARFDGMRADPAVETVELAHDASAPVPVTGEPAPGQPSTARSGDVRVTGEFVEWRCRRCDGWNALDLAACRACGAPREGFGTAPTNPTARVPAATARFVSMLLPGLGHLLMGAIGSGIARAVLFVLWVVGAIALLGDATVGGVVLALGAIVLWAATLIDVHRLPTGQRELLGARGLGALVAVVTVLLVLGAAGRVVDG
jgi:hypothetical protein